MTATHRSPLGKDLLDRLARAEPLDKAAEPLAKLVRDVTKPAPLKEALSGTWLGHPVHPLLIALPLGTWLSAILVDWVGGKGTEKAADRLVLAGVVTAAPTVVTGASDWADTTVGNPAVRRIGLAHAASNWTATGLFAASALARVRGARLRGKLYALLGGGAVGLGGYLGGHLSYAEGVGVDQTTFEPRPEGWVRVAAEGEVAEGQMRKVQAGEVDVLLARWQGELHALSNRCCHRGGPLDEGELHDGAVTCPWHQSTFRLSDGGVERGPAPFPQPRWEVRTSQGGIEVRKPAEPTAN
jgi:nitrite reductase/ring-hydroxylating ferredoxin subunit